MLTVSEEYIVEPWAHDYSPDAHIRCDVRCPGCGDVSHGLKPSWVKYTEECHLLCEVGVYDPVTGRPFADLQ